MVAGWDMHRPKTSSFALVKSTSRQLSWWVWNRKYTHAEKYECCCACGDARDGSLNFPQQNKKNCLRKKKCTWQQVADGAVGGEVEIFPDEALQQHMGQHSLRRLPGNPRHLHLLHSQGRRALAEPRVQDLGGGDPLTGGRRVVQDPDHVLTQLGHVTLCNRVTCCDTTISELLTH